MAAPIVSGILGLLIAREGPQDFYKLRHRVLSTAVPVPELKGKNLANGRIDAYSLLSLQQ